MLRTDVKYLLLKKLIVSVCNISARPTFAGPRRSRGLAGRGEHKKKKEEEEEEVKVHRT